MADQDDTTLVEKVARAICGATHREWVWDRFSDRQKAEFRAEAVAAIAAVREHEAALLDGVWQVLDDMGAEGTSCCLAAKAQLRVAYEPFRQPDVPVDYPLENAQAVLAAIATKTDGA